MSPIRIFIAITIFVVGMHAEPHAASPRTEDDDALVTRLFENARTQKHAGNYDGAIKSLQDALRIRSTPWLMYSLARVYEDAGKYELARSHYELSMGENADPETRQRAQEGLVRLAIIGERGSLKIEVAPSDATVTIDGEVWAGDNLNQISLTAGPHHIAIAHADYLSHEQTVSIVGGQLTSVVVALGQKSIPPPTPSPAPAPESVDLAQNAPPGPIQMISKDDTATNFGAWKWISLGAGLTGLAVGGYLLVDSADDWDVAKTNFELSSSERSALVDRGETKQVAGAVSIAVGGCFVIASIVMVIAEASSEESSTLTYGLILDRNGGGVVLSGGF